MGTKTYIRAHDKCYCAQFWTGSDALHQPRQALKENQPVWRIVNEFVMPSALFLSAIAAGVKAFWLMRSSVIRT